MSHRSGITLLEVLVSIFVIVLLSAIVSVVAIQGEHRGRRIDSILRMKQLTVAAEMYSSDGLRDLNYSLFDLGKQRPDLIPLMSSPLDRSEIGAVAHYFNEKAGDSVHNRAIGFGAKLSYFSLGHILGPFADDIIQNEPSCAWLVDLEHSFDPNCRESVHAFSQDCIQGKEVTGAREDGSIFHHRIYWTERGEGGIGATFATRWYFCETTQEQREREASSNLQF
jgi:type II secretory pathway pseudopilin PulG